MTTGHRCKLDMCNFAEKVMFKFNTDKNKRNKMESEWGTGFFVGANSRTDEYIIAKEDGVFSCATITRYPDD